MCVVCVWTVCAMLFVSDSIGGQRARGMCVCEFLFCVFGEIFVMCVVCVWTVCAMLFVSDSRGGQRARGMDKEL